MPEYSFQVTVAEHGQDPENGSRVLAGFEQACPDAEPTIAQNTRTGELTIALGLEAESVEEALELGRRICVDGLNASGLEPSKSVGIHVDETTPDRDPVAA